MSSLYTGNWTKTEIVDTMIVWGVTDKVAALSCNETLENWIVTLCVRMVDEDVAFSERCWR